MTSYRIDGLAPDAFAPLFALDDHQLRAHGMRRVVADNPTGYPCRVSLSEAEPGETLMLLTYEHHACDGPYRASGPIYVRENAARAAHLDNQLPAMLRTRHLSLRAYDSDGWMLAARALDGSEADAALAELFADARVAQIHAHNARYGCFLCSVARA
ncbi:DUF1203 domain-containing protein [Pseudomonas sp. CGJS7]|uniref:DUF1203 domain-containing protein n=1 Tax=Pseudomonas sp. CGJS7 TaxID=3109348 RepID=UPI0030092D86